MSERLFIPAMRATIGEWTYYITQMRMIDVAERISVAEEIHQSKTLNELIQRSLTARSKEITNYLLNQPQRFFNAFVFGVYGGAPQWYDLNVKNNSYLDAEKELPQYVDDAIGLLELRGDEKLFAIDGQHRVVGIRRAVKVEPKLGEEHIAAIFIGHKNDEEGLQRTRRLFTVLNRYAKPVSKRDKIALDEDDVVAIVTRRMVEKHGLFAEKVAISSANSLNDAENITTIGTLYDSLDIFLRDQSLNRWRDFKRLRPTNEEIDKYYEEAEELWNLLCESISSLNEYREAPVSDKAALPYRNHEKGGHLLFRPIGLLLVIRVIRSLIEMDYSITQAVELISKIPMILSDAPWAGLFWDPQNKRMITSKENRNAAEKMIFHALGGKLSRYKTSERELESELAGILNREPEEIELPIYV